MKNILFLLLCLSLFACSKSTLSDNNGEITSIGQWTQERFANNPDFKNAKEIISKWGKITMELNSKDSCVYFVHHPTEGDIIITKSLCDINNDFITVKGGLFSPCENYYLKEKETIAIHELTTSRMVLKWNKDQIKEWFEPENLTASTYYTEFKRIK